ncbi:putative oxidoreductase-like protein [Hapsidospora chrysogenum ATCC 11550]|uniref:Putative oxidoreductase-like protein n=1 Tax=Hapsidospora chrysogenum (strain ATCC 11550 / CBS 779.69 / DSM 880 / IAM 14645 / JCM 23072 / IMI 49137) TaxID=857340 RepID=A0A086SV47_HAPC1|nr:putative oxidoreductase-like protein [Hapsidospora chrysogenum ATCC 11550]
MAEFLIKDEDLASLKGEVVIVTGASSGIGLATVQLLLSLGANVVGADIQPPAEPIDSSAAFTFQQTDVTVWSDLVSLFKRTKQLHGRVDHVFANAGISPRADYLSTELDENGDLKEPTHRVLDTNTKGVINTTTLAIYHMRHQPEPLGGSVTITSSIAGVQRFRAVDYTASKHAVLGFMRGLKPVLAYEKVPVRINALAPSWTRTGVVPEVIMKQLGVELQTPLTVGRAAAALMADKKRDGHLVHVERGRYKEIEEAVLLPAYKDRILGDGVELEDTTLMRMMEAMGGVYKDKV